MKNKIIMEVPEVGIVAFMRGSTSKEEKKKHRKNG